MAHLIMVTGADGMLGQEVVRKLRERLSDVHTVHPFNRRALDITDRAAVFRSVPGHQLVINCAAYTNVDSAEDPGNRRWLYDVNCTGPRLLAQACHVHQAKLIHVSTDFVFGGAGQSWPYDESSLTMPVNAYGASKACGEKAVLLELPDDGFVLRTAWLYGTDGFVPKILRIGLRDESSRITAPVDQMGNPTSTSALATRIASMSLVLLAGRSAPPGVYHAAGMGATTRYHLAQTAFSLAGLDPSRVVGITTDELKSAANRPRYTVLSQGTWEHAGISPMPNWKAMLEEAVPKIVARIREEDSTIENLQAPRVGV